MTDQTSATPDGQGTKGYRALVLLVLMLVYMCSFLDRVLLGILAPQIQHDMKLSDTQLGLMLGPPFAVVYSVLALPIAWFADRFSRTWIMTAALTVWTGCTALCGQAAGFPQLLAARMGVGVGEAGGVAPSYSMIADYFPKASRARALALYAFAIPIGSAIAAIAGGLLAQTLGWRLAFLYVGLAGVPLIPLLRILVRDPARIKPAAGEGPGLVPTFRVLAKKPAFWLLSFGAGSSSIVGYGLLGWFPAFLKRSFHFSPSEWGLYFGGLLLAGGMIGVWAGGWLGDRLGRVHRAAYALTPAVAFLLSGPAYYFAFQSPSRTTAFLLFLIPQALALMWLGPVTAAVQHMTPQQMRSTASSIFLLINNFLGLVVGPFAFGWLSDLLKPAYGAESLHVAILWCLSLYGVAALLMFLAAGRLKRDWVE